MENQELNQEALNLQEATETNIEENQEVLSLPDADEVPELFKADPDVFFIKWKEIVKNAGLDFGEFLGSLGFDIKQVHLVFTKTIPEAISTINRRIALEIYRMNRDTNIPSDVLRASLGVSDSSEQWLSTMEELIIPYFAYYAKHGKVDVDFHMKNKEGLYVIDEEGFALKEPQVERPVAKTPTVEEKENTEEGENCSSVESIVE